MYNIPITNQTNKQGKKAHDEFLCLRTLELRKLKNPILVYVFQAAQFSKNPKISPKAACAAHHFLQV